MRAQRAIASILITVFSCSQLGFADDLSPVHWNHEDRERAEQLENSPFPPRAKIIEGGSGLITATMSPIAIEAGLETLKRGGTAADAAATVALTQITTALGSYVSYAGIMQLVYYDAKSRKVYSLDAPWNSYLAESDPKTIPVDDLGPVPFAETPTKGAQGRKTLVPGFMAGIRAMHKRFGRLPFRELFQPAIYYAEHGVKITPLLASYFRLREKYLSRTAEGREFMSQAGDELPKPGDVFIQRDLAQTLREVSRKGARYMYTGAWGRQFVKAVQQAGGKATVADMKRYRPIWEQPLSTTFAGDTVYAPGKSSDGSYQVLEALNLAETLGLDQMGPYDKDPRAFYYLTSIARFVEFDSLNIPQFAEFKRAHGLGLSQEDRITKRYAKTVAAVMESVAASIGKQQGIQTQQSRENHSDAVVVVDRWGNVAALCHSINTVVWGTSGIVVGGIPIPDPAGFQQRRLAAIKPGDPLPDDMAPAIATADGKPTFAISTVGSSLVPETVRIMIASLANHLDLQAVMAAPPLLLNLTPSKPGENAYTRSALVPEGAYPPEFLKKVQQLGLTTEPQSRAGVYTVRGTAVVAAISPENGKWQSAETPGVFGFAAAY